MAHASPPSRDAYPKRPDPDQGGRHPQRQAGQALLQDWSSLYRVPGFAGVRRQVGELVSYWRHEWQKPRGADPCPMSFPHNEHNYRVGARITKGEDGKYWTTRGFPTTRRLPTLFYVRKQKDVGEPLRKLVRQQEETDAASRSANEPESA